MIRSYKAYLLIRHNLLYSGKNTLFHLMQHKVIPYARIAHAAGKIRDFMFKSWLNLADPD